MAAQLLAMLIGVELMVAPALLGFGGVAADSYRTAGPVVAAVGLVAAFRVTRGLRWLNVLPGLWLIVAPPLLGHHAADAWWNSVLAGAAVTFLATRGRTSMDLYGGGWRAVWPRGTWTGNRERPGGPGER